MVDRKVVLKDVYALIPRTCVYVTLHNKSHFTVMVKLRILRWEDYAGLLRGPNAITGDFIRRPQEGQNHNVDVMIEIEI